MMYETCNARCIPTYAARMSRLFFLHRMYHRICMYVHVHVVHVYVLVPTYLLYGTAGMVSVSVWSNVRRVVVT